MKRIWLLDDHEDEVLPLVHMINTGGMGVEVVMQTNSSEAIDDIKQLRVPKPDVILLDLIWYEHGSDTKLQKYQWWDILAALHSSKTFQNVPVVVLTSKISEKTSKECDRELAPGILSLRKNEFPSARALIVELIR